MRLTPNILVNRANLYRVTPGQDADAGVVGDGTAYPAPFAIDVPCSVQPLEPERRTDQERVGAKIIWRVVFGSVSDAGRLGVNDLVLYVDRNGTNRHLVVTLVRDLAGRGGAFEARCEERV